MTETLMFEMAFCPRAFVSHSKLDTPVDVGVTDAATRVWLENQEARFLSVVSGDPVQEARASQCP